MAKRRVLWRGQPHDVTIIVGKKRINAHKLLLASRCHYFDCMFTRGFVESTANCVTINEMDDSTIGRIIHYFYTDDIQSRCIDYLKHNINAQNCLGIKRKAEEYQLVDLTQAALLFCLRYFENVARSDEFLQLSLDSLIAIVSSDNLEVTSEQIVREATTRWVKHNISDREAHLPTLMGYVRYQPTILNKCCRYFDQVLGHLAYQMNLTSELASPTNEVASSTQPRFKRRWSQNTMYTLSHDYILEYNPITDDWPIRGINYRCMTQADFIALNDRLYMLCKYNVEEGRPLQSCDPSSDEWDYYHPSPPLDCGEFSDSIGLDGFLYLMGKERRSKSYRYDPTCDTWSHFEILERITRSSLLATLDGCIYAIDKYHTESVRRLDPRVDKWHRVAPITEIPISVAYTSLNGCLYAIEGSRDGWKMKSGQKYESRTNSWHPIAPMNCARRNYCVAALDGLIYAAGGGTQWVEAYDPITNEWSYRESLPDSVYGLAVL